jgi:hypothetical protein
MQRQRLQQDRWREDRRSQTATTEATVATVFTKRTHSASLCSSCLCGSTRKLRNEAIARSTVQSFRSRFKVRDGAKITKRSQLAREMRNRFLPNEPMRQIGARFFAPLRLCVRHPFRRKRVGTRVTHFSNVNRKLPNEPISGKNRMHKMNRIVKRGFYETNPPHRRWAKGTGALMNHRLWNLPNEAMRSARLSFHPRNPRNPRLKEITKRTHHL